MRYPLRTNDQPENFDNPTMTMPLFIKSRWIWDASDPRGIVPSNLLFYREFEISAALLNEIRLSGEASLGITADSYYQVWINGKTLGHGPAKSPEGERFADTYDLSIPGLLCEGHNRLEVLVHALGVGSMSACPGPAGLIFEIVLPGGRIIPSDASTRTQPDPRRCKRTVRRWIMPEIEDVDATQSVDPALWCPATPVESPARLVPRPIAAPSRTPLTPRRVVAFDEVRFPNFSCAFRIKPYLVDEKERRRCNLYGREALIVADLISDRDQDIELVPETGQVVWYFGGERVIRSSGWMLWSDDPSPKTLRLQKGANRFVGVHANPDHFQDVSLAAFISGSVFPQNPFGEGGFQVIPADGNSLVSEGGESLSAEAFGLIERGPHPAMDPAHTLIDGNAQCLAVNARVCLSEGGSEWRGGDIDLPPPTRGPGHASRLILDLGEVNNGWLAFSARGKAGDRLTFSFFESLDPGAPLRVSWPPALNNAVRYRLGEGWQSFESLLSYGVRYVTVHHEGEAPVRLRDLRFHSANCGNLRSGEIRTGDVALDAIHALCEQTLYAATDDTLTDCPTYEAVNWNFDNRLGTLADLTVFRNLDILRNTIEQYTRDPMYPGLVRSHVPSTWENRIPVFSFHWILLCRDFYWQTADDGFLACVFPQIERGLEEALGMINPELGLLRWSDSYNSWHLMDWGHGRDDDRGIVSGEQALFLGALEAGEYLARRMQKAGNFSSLKENLRRWESARADLAQAIDRHLWSPERDAYADSLYDDGSRSGVTSQVSNCALALHGAGNAEWRERLHRRLRNEDPSLLPFGSPMGLFYILEFLDQRDDADTIFRIIRAKWTPMLEAGDRTAWEHFPEYGSAMYGEPTRSRCHPFATYILKYYTKYLLGIRFTEPGQRGVLFAPRPPAGIAACQGSLPVGSGWIRTSWRRQGGRLDSAIETPLGIPVLNPETRP